MSTAKFSFSGRNLTFRLARLMVFTTILGPLFEMVVFIV